MKFIALIIALGSLSCGHKTFTGPDPLEKFMDDYEEPVGIVYPSPRPITLTPPPLFAPVLPMPPQL